MKTAISLPNETFERVERAAAKLGVSRREFYARAAERWLDALDDDQTTDAINRAIAGTPDDTGFTDAAASALALDHRARVIARGELWWTDLGLPRGVRGTHRRPPRLADGPGRRWTPARARTYAE